MRPDDRLPHRALRHLPDRMLHPLRRRRALGALADLRDTSSVLFVCLGNLYRSPFAAGFFAELLPEPLPRSIRSGSAGLAGHGRECPPDAVAAAARRGVNLAAHHSSLFTAAHASTVDLILVMSAEQKRIICERFGCSPKRVLVLGDLDPRPIEARDIPDPLGCPEQVLEASYDRIERCVRELARVISPSE